MLGMVLRNMAASLSPPVRESLRTTRGWLTSFVDERRLRRVLRGQSFPRPIRSVVFVCKGNICRSPLAEAYLKNLLEKQGSAVLVRSAGLETTVGKPAHDLALLVGREAGVSLLSHTTKPLTKQDVEQADLIVVMEWAHWYRLSRLYPDVRPKVFLLRQFSGAPSVDLRDPYGGALEDFQQCFAVIKHSCERLVDQIRQANGCR